MDRLKARLVANGYTQIFDSGYYDTFSHVAKMTFVRLLLSMAAMSSWPLYQLDIKNVFLHGDLAEEVLNGATAWICFSRGVWFGMQATSFLILPKAVPSSLV